MNARAASISPDTRGPAIAVCGSGCRVHCSCSAADPGGEEADNAMASFSHLDQQPTVIARSPFVDAVQGARLDGLVESSRGEDVIEL